MPQEIIEMRGHLIDSLTLPKALDLVMAAGGCFEIKEVRIGRRPQDPSFARILVAHKDRRTLEHLLREAARHGAEPVERREAKLAPAPKDGVFPDNFHATTNLDTSVFLGGRWIVVKNPEMDAGILVGRDRRRARTVKMGNVRKGDLIVVGHDGVRVVPPEARRAAEDFEFMTSEVSTEKPKGALIAGLARRMKAERRAGRPILWVCGPAVVHSGAAPLMERLIEAGYVQVLFAGNALAAHDIEHALYGTSLGVALRTGALTRGGPREPPPCHQHHPPPRRHPRRCPQGRPQERHPARLRPARRPVRPGRLHPRRRPPAGGHHRHGAGAGGDARPLAAAAAGRHVGHPASLRRHGQHAPRADPRRLRGHPARRRHQTPGPRHVPDHRHRHRRATVPAGVAPGTRHRPVRPIAPTPVARRPEPNTQGSSMSRPVFLMCRPTFYGVEYEINPWMSVRRQPDRGLARRQWEALRAALRAHLGAKVELCRSRPGLPDMTFTANAGLVRGRTFVPSRFRHKERAGETPFLTSWFRRRGYRIVPPPAFHAFEGSGDAMFAGERIVAGYLRRSDIQPHTFLGAVFDLPVLSLALVDPRFYHLDTCFAPLDERAAVFYPGAFDRYALRALRACFRDLIAVRADEAEHFACNLVAVGKRAILSRPCPRLARALEERGYNVARLDFSEFIKAGGAGRCLTLRLR